MTATIRNNQKLTGAGDSIMAFGWVSSAGGLLAQLNAQLVPSQQAFSATLAVGSAAAKLAAGATPATTGTVTVPVIPIRFTNTGIPGQTSADLLANVQTQIIATAPDVVLINIGTNDVGRWPWATEQANLTGIVNAIRAYNPSVPIVFVGVMCYSEQWTSGPPLDWSPADPATDTWNTNYQAFCAANGCTFIPWRPSALTYESVHNTPAPGAVSGILTSDGKHPNATGQLEVSNWSVGSFSVQP